MLINNVEINSEKVHYITLQVSPSGRSSKFKCEYLNEKGLLRQYNSLVKKGYKNSFHTFISNKIDETRRNREILGMKGSI